MLVQCAYVIARNRPNKLRNEKYIEDELKPKKIQLPKFQSISELSLDEMIDMISKAGFAGEEISSNG